MSKHISGSVEAELRERIKELTCLYGIAQIAGRPDITKDEIVHGIVEILPSAWQYPEIALARITFDGASYTTGDFNDGCKKQVSRINVNGICRGMVEVVYTENKEFLREERKLIDAIAAQIGHIIERKQAEDDKLDLHDQLRHADRLSTIGMLAAGVAHELNEPLNNILGFAQLAKKCSELPEIAKHDIEKIENTSLYAREIVKKLLVFARQMPPKKTHVDLNQIIEDSLYFLEARSAKEGIEIIRKLSPDLPEIFVDPSQFNQLLVNLFVNAFQASPEGGNLTVVTSSYEKHVFLTVEDTGTGMSDEIKEKIFLPFFTTKDVGQGTGLGLPVVHGIVKAHGGSIEVESVVGSGTKFVIKIPLPETQENTKENN